MSTCELCFHVEIKKKYLPDTLIHPSKDSDHNTKVSIFFPQKHGSD